MDRLTPLIYDELRGLASRELRRERPDHTLQTTALAHEAWLKLVDQRNAVWKDRVHFLAVAATSIRRILIDHARRRGARKRGGAGERLMLEEADQLSAKEPSELLAIDAAMTRLARFDERKARVVELRFFGGLEVEEVAEALGISSATVKRDWSAARAWLSAHIKEGAGDGAA